jgi:hypothetical protein
MVVTMRAWTSGVLVLLLVGLSASPAFARARSVDVRISVHLRSDYRFAYDFVDTSDPDCPSTIRTSSRVVTDMPTVRPARFRITRFKGGYAFFKRGGGRQRADRAVDMRADMTRSSEGGSETPCFGFQPYPTVKCGKRSWALDGRPGITRNGRLVLALEVPVFPSLERVMADDEWREGGCGYDSTQADVYITQTRNEQGRFTPPYWAPISVKRLFRPGRRTLRLRDTLTFTTGRANQQGGGYTEVRTVRVTIRKLR